MLSYKSKQNQEFMREERQMQYSHEVKEMCCVKKGCNHGPAPIPQEGQWTQSKEIKDISGLTHGVGCCAPQQGACQLTLNAKAEPLLKQIPETDSSYVFLNPKTGAPYKLYEFYYLHKKILKRARLPWVAFRDLQRQCMEVRI